MNTVLLALICISFGIFLIYNIVALFMFGVPPSLSMTAYLFEEKIKGGRFAFLATLSLMAFALLPAWLELTPEPGTFQFLAFLACAGLLFVAATPNFLPQGYPSKGKPDVKTKGFYLPQVIHMVAAIVFAAGCGLAWVFVYSTQWWVIFIWLGFFVLMALYSKTIKSAFEYWLEMIAFFTIYAALIIQLSLLV